MTDGMREAYGASKVTPTADENQPKVNLHETTDAAVWAKEFKRIWQNRMHHVDEADMIGWFSNAIEIGRAAGHKDLNKYAAECHKANEKWWISVDDGVTRLNRNKGELLALIHSEISEALEGERKNLMDDKLPHRRMAEVELADALIRIFDYAAGFGYDLQGAYEEKMAYNAQREDHKHEARKIAGGKQF